MLDAYMDSPVGYWTTIILSIIAFAILAYVLSCVVRESSWWPQLRYNLRWLWFTTTLYRWRTYRKLIRIDQQASALQELAKSIPPAFIHSTFANIKANDIMTMERLQEIARQFETLNSETKGKGEDFLTAARQLSQNMVMFTIAAAEKLYDLTFRTDLLGPTFKAIPPRGILSNEMFDKLVNSAVDYSTPIPLPSAPTDIRPIDHRPIVGFDQHGRTVVANVDGTVSHHGEEAQREPAQLLLPGNLEVNPDYSPTNPRAVPPWLCDEDASGEGRNIFDLRRYLYSWDVDQPEEMKITANVWQKYGGVLFKNKLRLLYTLDLKEKFEDWCHAAPYTYFGETQDDKHCQTCPRCCFRQIETEIRNKVVALAKSKHQEFIFEFLGYRNEHGVAKVYTMATVSYWQLMDLKNNEA